MGWKVEFPFPEFMIGFGFLLILFSEQLGLWWKETSPAGSDIFTIGHGHSHHNGTDHQNHLTGQDNQTFNPLQAVRRQTQASMVAGTDYPSLEDIEEETRSSDGSDTVTTPPGSADVKIVRSKSARKRHESTIKAHFDPHTHSTLRAILLVTALSLHAFFEGMALGLQSDREKIWTLFVALCIHKSLIAFSLGIRLVQSQLKSKTIALCCAIFCGMAVLGAVVGIVLMDNVSSALGSVIGGVLRGVACGTFLYVTFFEILPHELNPSGYRLIKLLTLALGFATVCIVFLIFPDA